MQARATACSEENRKISRAKPDYSKDLDGRFSTNYAADDSGSMQRLAYSPVSDGLGELGVGVACSVSCCLYILLSGSLTREESDVVALVVHCQGLVRWWVGGAGE